MPSHRQPDRAVQPRDVPGDEGHVVVQHFSCGNGDTRDVCWDLVLAQRLRCTDDVHALSAVKYCILPHSFIKVYKVVDMA